MIGEAYNIKVELDDKETKYDATTHLKPKGTLHECDQCGYAVTRKETLKRHIQYEHEGAEWR